MQNLSRMKRDLWKGIKIGIGISIGFGISSLLAVAVTGTFNSFTSGSLIRSADINANFTTLKTAIESIDLSNSVIPPGTIVAFGGTVPPAGWAFYIGGTLSRTVNAPLFAAIGTNYGAGDGSTTFHLPDFRGMFLRGVDAGTGHDPNAGTRAPSNAGGNSGNAVGSYQDDAFQGHWHELGEEGSSAVIYSGAATLSGTSNNVARPISASGLRYLAKYLISDGGNGTPRATSETRPANVYVNYIIKL